MSPRFTLPMDRREFLRTSALAALATAAAGSLSGCAREPEIDHAALAHPALLTVFGAESVRAFGATYRENVTREADIHVLRSAILRGQRRRLRPRSVDAASLEQQVREDFAAGRVVLVDGWVLSRTEALQCALFSLVG